MRVVFMGTPDFAVGTLEEIIKAKQAYNRLKDYRDLIIILG